MIVFDIIWNVIGILFAILGLLLASAIVLIVWALVAGLGEHGNSNKKGSKNDEETK